MTDVSKIREDDLKYRLNKKIIHDTHAKEKMRGRHIQKVPSEKHHSLSNCFNQHTWRGRNQLAG
jgi:hypothetical protein